jgi:hypothetical protein
VPPALGEIRGQREERDDCSSYVNATEDAVKSTPLFETSTLSVGDADPARTA